jgi:hypothetical protein
MCAGAYFCQEVVANNTNRAQSERITPPSVRSRWGDSIRASRDRASSALAFHLRIIRHTRAMVTRHLPTLSTAGSRVEYGLSCLQ